MEFLQTTDFWIGLLKIVWINIILSGDNAVAAIEAFEDAGMDVPPIVGEDQYDFLTKIQGDDVTGIAPTFPTYQWRTAIDAAPRARFPPAPGEARAGVAGAGSRPSRSRQLRLRDTRITTRSALRSDKRRAPRFGSKRGARSVGRRASALPPTPTWPRPGSPAARSTGPRPGCASARPSPAAARAGWWRPR